MARRLTPEEREERAQIKEARRRERLASSLKRAALKDEEKRKQLLRKSGLYCPNMSCPTRSSSVVSGIDTMMWKRAERTGTEYPCPNCGKPVCETLTTGLVWWFGAIIPKTLRDERQEYRIYECDVCYRPSVYSRHVRCAFKLAHREMSGVHASEIPGVAAPERVSE